MTDERAPADAAIWAAMLTRPAAAAVVIGVPIGLAFGAIAGVAFSAAFGTRLFPVAPRWAEVLLGAPAGVLAVYLELTKPY
jgi:hypothetical protein